MSENAMTQKQAEAQYRMESAFNGRNQAAMNQIAPAGINVSRVAMPLVRLMLEGGLSWSEKEKVADAIQDALRIHKSHKDEAEHLRRGLTASAAGQLGPMT